MKKKAQRTTIVIEREWYHRLLKAAGEWPMGTARNGYVKTMLDLLREQREHPVAGRDWTYCVAVPDDVESVFGAGFQEALTKYGLAVADGDHWHIKEPGLGTRTAVWEGKLYINFPGMVRVDYNADGWRDLEVEPEHGHKIPCGAKAVFPIEEDDEYEEDLEDDLELLEVLDLGELGQYFRLLPLPR